MRGIVLLSRAVKTPVPSWFKGALANNGTVTGLGAGTTPGTLGTITGGRPFKGFVPSVGARSIFAIYSSNAADLVLDLSNRGGGLSLDYFTRILVEDGTGTRQEFLTADATLLTIGGTGPTGEALWVWGTGSSRVWATGDATEVKNVWVI